MSSWLDTGVSSWIIRQLDELNLRTPTPVQTSCISQVLEGRDVLGCAKTGTGKTLAFALPIIQKLSADPYGIFALVLTPTRELAFQIDDQFKLFGKQVDLTSSVIVGGRHQMAQAQELSRRPHVVVATPGRLSDHIESDSEGIAKCFRLIKFLVLDEADRLLDGEYAAQLKMIFNVLPRQRQTLLFSATITSALTQLHQVSIKKPFFFEEKTETTTIDKLDQRYVLCPRAVKDAYLVYVVRNFCAKRETSSIIIFCYNCKECQALSMMFKSFGFKVGCLHSRILQNQRTLALSHFRSGKIKILICTDVASRGLDIPHIDLVINHNVPRSPKTYIHRVGRSARAGRFGAAITFVTQYDMILLKAIEELVGKQLERLEVNDKRVSQYAAQILASKREAEIRVDRLNLGERKEIFKRKELAMEGMDHEEIEKTINRSRMRNKMIGQKKSMRKPIIDA